MAPRKMKPEAAPAKARTTPVALASRASRQPAPQSSGDPNRLLREAAWSRMFGRIETKNPFTR